MEVYRSHEAPIVPKVAQVVNFMDRLRSLLSIKTTVAKLKLRVTQVFLLLGTVSVYNLNLIQT